MATTNMVTAEKIRTDMEEANRNAIIKSITDIHKSLVIDYAEQATKLPESVFKEVFLPYFIGQKNFQDDEDMLQGWIGIAGNPMKSVDVYSDTTRKILFRVPPLADVSVINVITSRGANLSNIFSNFELHSGQHPAAGRNYIYSALAEKYKTLTQNSELHEEHLSQWNIILDYYNLNTKTNDTTMINKNNSAEDDLVYD